MPESAVTSDAALAESHSLLLAITAEQAYNARQMIPEPSTTTFTTDRRNSPAQFETTSREQRGPVQR